MKASTTCVALSLVLGIGAPLSAQATPTAAPTQAEVVAAAKAIMVEARFCTLITIGLDGQPQARIVDPFPPDSAFTIWIATNPATRKVQEIRANPRVTLLCYNSAAYEFVTVLGTAALDTDATQKAAHWKEAWEALYSDQNRGDDYLLLRVTPSRLEVVSMARGMSNDPKTWRPVTADVSD
jgi:general stress protein 26